MILMNFINENCSNFVRNMGEALLDNFSRTMGLFPEPARQLKQTAKDSLNE